MCGQTFACTLKSVHSSCKKKHIIFEDLATCVSVTEKASAHEYGNYIQTLAPLPPGPRRISALHNVFIKTRLFGYIFWHEGGVFQGALAALGKSGVSHQISERRTVGRGARGAIRGRMRYFGEAWKGERCVGWRIGHSGDSWRRPGS